MWTLVMGASAGFITWIVVLIGGERLLSTVLPDQFGRPQAAFQKAIEDGGTYSPQTTHLVLHVGLALVACLIAGFIGELISGQHSRAAWTLGTVLLCVGLAKAALTWKLVPIWYHLAFTSVLLPATLIGALLHRPSSPSTPVETATKI